MKLENVLLLINVFLLVVLVCQDQMVIAPRTCKERMGTPNLAQPHKIIFGGIPIAANTITSDPLGEGENRPEDYDFEKELEQRIFSSIAI